MDQAGQAAAQEKGRNGRRDGGGVQGVNGPEQDADGGQDEARSFGLAGAEKVLQEKLSDEKDKGRDGGEGGKKHQGSSFWVFLYSAMSSLAVSKSSLSFMARRLTRVT